MSTDNGIDTDVISLMTRAWMVDWLIPIILLSCRSWIKCTSSVTQMRQTRRYQISLYSLLSVQTEVQASWSKFTLSSNPFLSSLSLFSLTSLYLSPFLFPLPLSSHFSSLPFPQIQLGGLREYCELSQQGVQGRSPSRKLNLVDFKWKIWHLVRIIIFSDVHGEPILIFLLSLAKHFPIFSSICLILYTSLNASQVHKLELLTIDKTIVFFSFFI